MKVTGYKIREAIARNKLRRETAASHFADTLHVFPGEQKQSPDEVGEAILTAELRIAKLQVIQTHFNLLTEVTVTGYGLVPIAFCVKAIGGLERLEKLWRGGAIKKKDRFIYSAGNPLLRDEKQVAAVVIVQPKEAARRAEALQIKIASLREAVGVANGRELEFPDLDASLFE